ncbi:unnamed protein product [Moneuplotes crassus]|uniref:Uncharacterized protein n=2 Tax=Euplotes crassus TaxID=5936 RepID=A0AAD1Y3D6_EUPCR|nr:unnamed protein product [Moneuplotes crassus]
MSSLLFRRQIAKARNARKLGLFPYPHTFNKDNPAFLNYPKEDRYSQIQREFNPGDMPQLAYQNVRKFPDWYKPYLNNYYSHGFLVVYFMAMVVYTWTYRQEIKLVKGRKKIIDYDHKDCQTFAQKRKRRYAKERIAAGDEQWTRYLEPKARNEHHH